MNFHNHISGARTGSAFVGQWNVSWSTGTKSSYSIEHSDSEVRMRILACDWSTASCNTTTFQQGNLQPSLCSKFSKEEGWVKVQHIHDDILTLYMRKRGDMLYLVWYKPGYAPTGIGTKGTYVTYVLQFFNLSHPVSYTHLTLPTKA